MFKTFPSSPFSSLSVYGSSRCRDLCLIIPLGTRCSLVSWLKRGHHPTIRLGAAKRAKSADCHKQVGGNISLVEQFPDLLLILSICTFRWAEQWAYEIQLKSAGSEQYIDISTQNCWAAPNIHSNALLCSDLIFFAKKLDSVPLREPPDIWNYMQSCSACRTAPQAFKLQKFSSFSSS